MSEGKFYRFSRGGNWFDFSQDMNAANSSNELVNPIADRNLGIRLVEEIEDPVSDVLKYHRLHRGGRWYFLSTIACVAICSYESLGTKYDHIGVRLVELIDD
jgi:hypothetical protein